jgi:DNA replication protein DnaC
MPAGNRFNYQGATCTYFQRKAGAVPLTWRHGYLPLDKTGADLLFQIISQRYERGSIVLTTNKAYKHWSAIFNNDSGITSAILDRLLHHAETVLIEGKSYRTKDQAEPPA